LDISAKQFIHFAGVGRNLASLAFSNSGNVRRLAEVSTPHLGTLF
jgi:hypothetical protein